MASRMTKAKMSSYMRNVGRSFGYAMVDSVKSMNPTVTALFKSTAEQSKDLYQSVKNFDAKSLGFEDSDLKGTLGQALKDLKNNALDDIRTGKWYNKERISQVESQMAEDMFGINFDDFGDFDDFNFDDTELDEEASITEDATKATVKAMDTVGGKVSTAVSTAAIKSADYIVESNRLNTKAMFGLTQAGFSQVNKGVATMNGNLQLLVSLAEPITTHIQNSALFYTKSQEYQNKSLELLKQIAANTAPKSSNSYKSSARGKSYTDFITSEGIIDIAALFENGAKRMKENTEMITSMLSFVPGGEKAILKMATASPLQFALTSAITAMFSMKDKQGNSIKSSFENFNKVLSNFSLGLLGKAKRATFGDNFFSPFLRTLRDFILPDNKVIKKPNTGAYEKGKVDWDGMSRKALMDIIPTQLSQILSALTGEEERRFDYNTGRWIKVSGLVNRRKTDLKKMTNNAGGDLFKTLSKSIDKSNMSARDKKAYKQQMEAFLEYAVMSGDDTFLEFLTNGFDFNKFGMSNSVGKDMQNRIRQIGRTRKGSVQLSQFAGNVYGARNNVSNYNSNVSGADLALFDKSTKRNGGKLIDLKDEYGFSQNDYLRHILGHVSYIAKNLKNLVGTPGVGGYNNDGTQIVWQEGDYITKSSDRITKMGSSSDRIKEANFSNNYNPNSGIEESLAEGIGPSYTDEERKYMEARKKNPNYPVNPKLEDSIKEKETIYSAGQSVKGFASSAYQRLRNGKGSSILSTIERNLEVSTEEISTALDNVSAGLNDFIYDNKSGIYALMNTMSAGVLDMIKSLIPKDIRDMIASGWKKLKESEFGKATGQTLKNIALSFFGSNKSNTVNIPTNEGMDFYRSELEDLGVDLGMFGGGMGSGLIGRVNRATSRIYSNQQRGGNFWGNYRRSFSSTPKTGYAGGRSRARRRSTRTRRFGMSGGATGDTSEAAAEPPEEELSDEAAESLLNKIASRVSASFIDKLSGLMSKTGSKKEKEEVKGTIQKLMEEAGLNKGAIGAGAVIGAGTSLLTGAFLGPIAGAAVGAATGFVAKSETAQKILFGDFDENGDRKGGLLNKEISNFFQKNGVSTAKGAGAGMLIGTFMGSPVLGAVLGATAGYISSSEKAKKAIFGDMETGEEGMIPLSLQKTLKEKFKFFAGGIGAAILLAPGPLIPKIAIGATLGAIIGKDNGKGFKEWLLGDGKDDKGFLGFTNERLFKPIIGTVDKAFNILTKSLKDKITQLIRGFGNFLKERLAKSKLGKGVLRAGEAVGNLAKKGLKGAVDIVGSPFRAANKALEQKALRQGYAYRGENNEYLTSAQRLAQYQDVIPENATDEERDAILEANKNKFTYRETGSSLVDQFLASQEVAGMDAKQYSQMMSDLKAAEKGGDISENATIQKILGLSQHGKDKLAYRDITHAIQQAEIDKSAREKATKEKNDKEGTIEFSVTNKIPSLIERVATGIDSLSDAIRSKLGLPSLKEAREKKKENKGILDSIESIPKVGEKLEEQASGEGSGLFRRLGLAGGASGFEDDPNVEQDENASNKLREEKKERQGFLSSIAAIPLIGSGLTKLTDIADSIRKSLDGDGEKKPGLFDKIKEALLGENGFLSGILGFFTGATGIGGMVGKLLGKFSLTNLFPLAMKGLGLFALYKALNGDLNELGSKIPTGSNDPNGDNGLTNTFDEDNQKKEDATQIKNDENGNGTNEDETAATEGLKYYTDVNGDRVRTGSRGGIDSDLKRNFASGLIMGKSSVVSKAVQKITGINITTKGLTTTLGNIAKDGADDLVMNVCANIGGVFRKICTGLSKLPFVGKLIDLNPETGTAQKITQKIGQYLSKVGDKAAIKKFAGLLSNALVVLKVAYIAGRVIDGWGNAESILGIVDDATIGQRFIAALIAGTNAAIPFIGDLIPDKVLVDIFMSVAEDLGLEGVEGLQEQRAKATEDVAAYIEATGDENMTIERYNQLGYTRNEDGTFTQGKARAGLITQAKMKITGFVDDIKEKSGEIIDNAKSEIDQFAKIRASIDSAMLTGDISKVWSIDVESLGTDDNPVGGFQKALASIHKLTVSPITLLIGAGKKIKDIGNLFTKIKSEYDQYSQITTSIKEASFTGDISKVWSVDVESAGSEDNPVGGIQKALAFINKLTVSPVTLLIGAGKKIKEFFGGIFDKIKSEYEQYTTITTAIDEKAQAGDLAGVWDVDVESAGTDDNPVGGIQKALAFIEKLTASPVAIVHGLGKGIREGIATIGDAISEDRETLEEKVDKIKEYAEDGEVGKIWSEKFDTNDNDPISGIWKLSMTVNRVVQTIFAVFNKLAGPIKDVIEKVEGAYTDIKNFIFGEDDTSGSSTSTGGKKVSGLASSSAASKLNGNLTKGGYIVDNSGTGSGIVSQFDPKYSNYKVGGRSFAANGCGPASAVMATGGNMSNAVNIAQRYQTPGGTDAAYFGEMFNRKGMSAHYYLAGGSSLVGDITSGKPTVLMGQDIYNTSKEYSPFGPNNHYVVANGFDRSGNLLISDPEQSGIRRYSPSILRNVKVGVSGGNSGTSYRRATSRPESEQIIPTTTNSTNSTTSSASEPPSGVIFINGTGFVDKSTDTVLSGHNKGKKSSSWSVSSYTHSSYGNKYSKDKGGYDISDIPWTKENAYCENLGIWSEISAEEINEWIARKSPKSPFNGHGDIFVEAGRQSGLDPRYILAHAALETNTKEGGWGSSNFAVNRHNYFGIGAFDSNPGNAYTFSTDSSVNGMAAGIIEGAKWIAEHYYNSKYKQTSVYKMRFNNMVHQYATDPEWHSKIGSIMAGGPANTRLSLAVEPVDLNISSSTTSVSDTSTSSTDSTSAVTSSNDSSSTGKKKVGIGGIFSIISSAFGNAFNKLFNGEIVSEDENESSELEKADTQENEQFSGVKDSTSTGILGTNGDGSGEYVNNFPYYNQTEDPWKSVKYGKGTIKSSGCGPTSAAMVLKSYGVDTTPTDAANYSVNNGFRVDGKGTSWSFFKSINDQAGLNTTQFTDKEVAKTFLNNNIPVIASMKAGDFTKGGHFVVLSKLNGSQLSVNDPASRTRSAKIWDADYAMNQAKQYWAVDKDGVGSINSSYATGSDSGTATISTNSQTSSSSDNYTGSVGTDLAVSEHGANIGTIYNTYDAEQRERDRKKSDELLGISSGTGSGLLHYGPSKAGNYILRDNTRNYYRTGLSGGQSGVTSVSGGNLLETVKKTVKSTVSSARQSGKDLGSMPANVSAIRQDTNDMNATLKEIAVSLQSLIDEKEKQAAKSSNYASNSELSAGGSGDYTAAAELRDIMTAITSV